MTLCCRVVVGDPLHAGAPCGRGVRVRRERDGATCDEVRSTLLGHCCLFSRWGSHATLVRRGVWALGTRACELPALDGHVRLSCATRMPRAAYTIAPTSSVERMRPPNGWHPCPHGGRRATRGASRAGSHRKSVGEAFLTVPCQTRTASRRAPDPEIRPRRAMRTARRGRQPGTSAGTASSIAAVSVQRPSLESEG